MDILPLLDRFAQSGGHWVIYLLLAINAVSIYVVSERWFHFWRISGKTDALQALVQKHLASGHSAALEERLRDFRCPEARVLSAVLSASGLGVASARERMQAQLIQERSALDEHLALLGTVGSNAPFVGLFGTVLGVIRSFHDLSLQGAAGGTTVMKGISEALIATAAGIFVAIPALVAFNYFKDRSKAILADSESLGRFAISCFKEPAGRA